MKDERNQVAPVISAARCIGRAVSLRLVADGVDFALRLDRKEQ